MTVSHCFSQVTASLLKRNHFSHQIACHCIASHLIPIHPLLSTRFAPLKSIGHAKWLINLLPHLSIHMPRTRLVSPLASAPVTSCSSLPLAERTGPLAVSLIASSSSSSSFFFFELLLHRFPRFPLQQVWTFYSLAKDEKDTLRSLVSYCDRLSTNQMRKNAQYKRKAREREEEKKRNAMRQWKYFIPTFSWILWVFLITIFNWNFFKKYLQLSHCDSYLSFLFFSFAVCLFLSSPLFLSLAVSLLNGLSQYHSSVREWEKEKETFCIK